MKLKKYLFIVCVAVVGYAVVQGMTEEAKKLTKEEFESVIKYLFPHNEKVRGAITYDDYLHEVYIDKIWTQIQSSFVYATHFKKAIALQFVFLIFDIADDVGVYIKSEHQAEYKQQVKDWSRGATMMDKGLEKYKEFLKQLSSFPVYVAFVQRFLHNNILDKNDDALWQNLLVFLTSTTQQKLHAAMR